MKTRFTLGILTVSVLIVGAAIGLWWRNQPEPNVNIYEPVPCIYADTITQTTAVPDWVTQTQLPSRSIDQEKLSPYEPLEEFTVDGQPVAWQTKNGVVVVDNRVFSDLQFIDVSGFSGDVTPTVIGQVMEVDLKEEEWRKLLEFLLKSHLIRTYAHLEADVCLDEENNTDTAYFGHFSGAHRYCTSDCYEKPLEFTFSVDKQTGNITIR